jgi:hypothetical protein
MKQVIAVVAVIPAKAPKINRYMFADSADVILEPNNSELILFSKNMFNDLVSEFLYEFPLIFGNIVQIYPGNPQGLVGLHRLNMKTGI